MIKPLPSCVVSAALVLALIGAKPLQALAGSSTPVETLAQRLRDDPLARVDAGRRLELFLLNPDTSNKSFVGADVDRTALGGIVQAWAGTADAGALATLIVVQTGSEPQLRSALDAWTGSSQIRRSREQSQATAFLLDAADKAARIYADPRSQQVIDTNVHAGDTAVPNPQSAVERARELGRNSRRTDVFGASREVQELSATPGGTIPGGTTPGVDPGLIVAAVSDHTRTNIPTAVLPAATLPLSLAGGPDRFTVPSPVNDTTDSTALAVSAVPHGRDEAQTAVVPNDGRVVPGEPTSLWDRVKEAVDEPLSDAYGFTFAGLEAQPVSFRDYKPALAYAARASSASFSNVTLYGHGAPGYMTVGQWSGDAEQIATLLAGKMKSGSTLDIKGCNTASTGGVSVNPGRGLSALTRRVLYFSIPYLMEGRDENMREMLENMWDADLARDTSRGLPAVKVCGIRTFGLVGDRLPVVGTLMGRRQATDSNAILGTKSCYVDGVEVDK